MENLQRNNRISPAELLVDETIFSTANGYIGTRGTFVEGYGKDFEYHQTYLNGFYNYYDYFYEENFTGFPQQGQKLVNLLDGTKMDFIVNGTKINMATCRVVSIERTYILSSGMTQRTIHYQTDAGFDFILKETKLVSKAYKELIALNVELSTPNYEGDIVVQSYLQKSVKLIKQKNDPRIHNQDVENLFIEGIDKNLGMILAITTKSNLRVASLILHNHAFEYLASLDKITAVKTFHIAKGQEIKISKYVIHTSNLYDSDFDKHAIHLRKELSTVSFEELVQKQTIAYIAFWEISSIKIEGKNDIEALLNYNIYQLNSSGGESQIHNISAKGLSGEGYEGHYFWDTEIYMIPFLS